MKWVPMTIILGMGVFLGSFFFTKPNLIEVSPQDKTPASSVKKERSVKIILVGDIMLDRGIKYMVEKYGGSDYQFPFLKIKSYLEEADISFANLESIISEKGTKVGSIYSFRAEPQSIEGLVYAGFNVLSVANNHIFDYGRTAAEDSFLRLKTAGIYYVGGGFDENESYSPVIKEVNGVKIAFLAYTNLGPETWKAAGENSGIAWISEDNFERVKKDIKDAKSRADILIVSLHTGEEYQKTPAQFQIEFSKTAIDAGADLVIGHHPHVVQASEIYKGGYIFYSLGNFIFDQSFSEETMRGQIVEVLVEDQKIKEVIPRKIKINDYFQPELIYESI